MVKRALIIGSQTGGLSGVHADVNAIGQVLERRGFTHDTRTGVKATRDGILEGYEALIAAHRPEDAAVIYYSGHGGRALNTSAPEGHATRYLQFLVPTDFDPSDGGFRGIFSFELSALLARLTAAGRNVTVILDCCHAAMMSREIELRPRAAAAALDRRRRGAPGRPGAPTGGPRTRGQPARRPAGRDRGRPLGVRVAQGGRDNRRDHDRSADPGTRQDRSGNRAGQLGRAWRPGSASS